MTEPFTLCALLTLNLYFIILTFRAPADCLQFFTGLTNEIKSPNYPNALQEALMYTICVRQERGFCGIEWNAVDSTSPDTFHLSKTAAPTAGLAVSNH